MTRKHSINTPDAPAAIGPYSQAVICNGLLYASGQIPLDPATMDLVEGDIQVQARRVLDNVAAVLGAAGSGFDQVIKATCFLKDMNDFNLFNDVYSEYFGDSRPARSTIEVARLPKDALCEIEVIAIASQHGQGPNTDA
jgi:2-iminobutanoate/2-iminopropanoate deaminase